MAFKLRPILSGLGLVFCGIVANEAWHRSMWGTMTGAGLAAIWMILLHVWQSEAGETPATSTQSLLPPDNIDSHRLLLDAAPTPMLAVEGDVVRALNRAARQLFATDDKVIPIPSALADRDVRHFRHEGRSWRIDRVLLTGENRSVITMIDIEKEERAAEARAAAEMIQILGHELLNGLAPIASLADSGRAVVAAPVPDALLLREILDTLTRHAEGLQRFVEAYRALARLPEPQRRPTAIVQLIDDIMRLSAGRWPEIAISCDIEGDPSWVLDRDQINQALLALIQNAAEAATADRGVDARIEIAVLQSEKQLAFEVRDNGNGLAPEYETLVFRPFHTTKQEGTGIGLSLARQIALAHGGTLTMRRKQQTIFVLRLPE